MNLSIYQSINLSIYQFLEASPPKCIKSDEHLHEPVTHCHGTCGWTLLQVCAWLYRLRHHSVYKPGDPRKGRERCSKLSASLHSFANELQHPSVWTQLQVRVMLCLRFSLQNLAGIGRATCLVSGCFRGVIGVVATCGNLGVSGWGNSWIKTVRLQLRYLKRRSEISCS